MKPKTQKLVVGISLLLGIFLLMGCSDSFLSISGRQRPSGDLNQGEEGGGGDNGGGGSGGQGNPKCEVYTKVLSEKRITKADILLAFDTSGSMREEAKKIVPQVEQIISQLLQAHPEGDYRIGVLLGHASEPYTGKLYCPTILDGNCNPVITVNAENPFDANDLLFLANLAGEGKSPTETNPEADGEAVLLSLFRATTTYLQHNRTLGFFRDDAAHVFILAADENAVEQAGPGNTNYQAYEVAFRTFGHNKVIYGSETHTMSGALLNKVLVNLSKGLPLFIGGLFETDTSSADYSYTYLKGGNLPNASLEESVANGIFTDIHNTPEKIGMVFEEIGKMVNEISSRELRHVLPRIEGVALHEIQEATLDDSTVDYSFNPDSMEFSISYADAVPRKTLSIRYCEAQ